MLGEVPRGKPAGQEAEHDQPAEQGLHSPVGKPQPGDALASTWRGWRTRSNLATPIAVEGHSRWWLGDFLFRCSLDFYHSR
jgi:hypothetical protein